MILKTILFSLLVTGIGPFTLISAHIAPNDAPAEISALVDVYNESVKKWTVVDSFVLGDFNADCSYVRKSDWPNILLWTDKRFTWLIDSDADTNVAMSSCAYDRIVVAGDNLQHKIINGSVGVFRFDRVYNLSTGQTNLVSDHYPVELQLMSQPPTEAQPPDGSLTSVEVHPLNGSQFPTQSSPTEVQPPDGSQAPVEVHPSNGSQFPTNSSAPTEVQPPDGSQAPVEVHPSNGSQFPTNSSAPTEVQPPDGSQAPVEVHPSNGSQFPTNSSAPTEVQPPDGSQAPVEVHPSNGSQFPTNSSAPTEVQPSDGQSSADSKTVIYWLYAALLLVIKL